MIKTGYRRLLTNYNCWFQARLTVVEEEEPSRDVPPEFTNLIRDTHALEGEPATFDCRVSGHPKPTVHWEKVEIYLLCMVKF